MYEIYSTLDLIRRVVSNSLFIFCFCNLIIIIILLGSKPILNTKRESESSRSTVNKRDGSGKGGYEESKPSGEVSKGMMIHAQKEEDENDRGDRANDEEADKKENTDEDELRKRVEEFIEKVNKGWKAELLRTSRLV